MPRRKSPSTTPEVTDTAAKKRKPRAAAAARAKTRAVDPKQLAIEAARTAEEDKCEEIVVLDLRGVSPVCDYFVIATGTSDRQMRAVADHIEAMARGLNERPFRTSGLNEGNWIVLDYVDIVVHLFDPEHRKYYDLEMLWGDAPRVKWERRAKAS